MCVCACVRARMLMCKIVQSKRILWQGFVLELNKFMWSIRSVSVLFFFSCCSQHQRFRFCSRESNNLNLNLNFECVNTSIYHSRLPMYYHVWDTVAKYRFWISALHIITRVLLCTRYPSTVRTVLYILY